MKILAALLCLTPAVLFVTFYVWSLCRAASSDIAVDDSHDFGGDDIR